MGDTLGQGGTTVCCAYVCERVCVREGGRETHSSGHHEVDEHEVFVRVHERCQPSPTAVAAAHSQVAVAVAHHEPGAACMRVCLPGAHAMLYAMRAGSIARSRALMARGHGPAAPLLIDIETTSCRH